jgi:hypothetical protein
MAFIASLVERGVGAVCDASLPEFRQSHALFLLGQCHGPFVQFALLLAKPFYTMSEVRCVAALEKI